MNRQMRAAVFEREGVLALKEVEVPKILKGSDVLLKVAVCSICGTDVHIMEVPPGYMATPQTILGHELVGSVVETGNQVTSLKAGDRVVVNPNESCGICRYCAMNLPNQCENIIPMGIGAHGGFAEYVRISEKSAYKIANDLPHEIAVFAEPLACVVNGTQKIKGQPGESALIIGAGPIGLLFLLMLKAAGMSPIVVSELSRLRRDLAARCGADRVVNPREEDLLAVVNETTGIGMDVAIDVVGTQIGAAIGSIRKGGRVLAFGVNAKAEEQINQSQITFKEATVCGTWLANATFPRAVRILESGVLDLKPLITHTLPLTKIHEGIELLARGEGVEILVVP